MPYKDPAKQREAVAAANRRYRANLTPQQRAAQNTVRMERLIRTGKHVANRPFVGIDGEGGDINGKHEYLLLRAGDHVLETGMPLTHEDVFPFLTSLPSGVTYVAYFFDYDVTMICRSLSAERQHRLMEREQRTAPHGSRTWPVDVGEYQIDYLPRKEFKIRRVIKRGEKGRVLSATKWVVINDVGTFYQCAFLKAITEWDIGTVEEREAIRTNKQARSTFAEITQETRDYNALEIRLLQGLMEAFRQTCTDIGYVPARWQGPGNLATSMMRRNGVPKSAKYHDLIPPQAVEMAANAYYGGRFEVCQIGQITCKISPVVHEYDICSAYPDAIRRLPCLLHSTWKHNGEWTNYTLAYGHFKAFENEDHFPWHSLPVRRKENNGIYFPTEGWGWYWGCEINAGIVAGHTRFEPTDTWTLQPSHCGCNPFRWVEGVYQQRLALGKTAKGRVLKLGLNSLYGKQAQSVGNPPYANPVYAGLITAMVRAKITRAIHYPRNKPGSHTCCSDVVMVATDAIYTLKPRPDLELGKGLGQWEHEEHSDLFIVQPGFYFTEDEQVKSRGVSRPVIVEAKPRFLDAWQRFLNSPTAPKVMDYAVDIPGKDFVGLRQAMAWNRPNLTGIWRDTVKTLSFDWSTKRDAALRIGDALYLAPYAGNSRLKTVPYSKDIGKMMRAQRLAATEVGVDNPDWAPDVWRTDDEL